MSKWSDLSRQVGWDYDSVQWPSSLKQIEEASPYQLLSWWRFLNVVDLHEMPTDWQAMLELIGDRLFKDIRPKLEEDDE